MRPLLLLHRWTGIAGLLLFVTWFASGIVMMYVRMPSLAREERLARAPILDLSSATVSPADVATRLDLRADRVVVSMRGERPIYRIGTGRDSEVVFADTGEVAGPLTEVEAIEAATAFSPEGASLRLDRHLTEPDQWTLQDRARLPMQVFALDDAAGTEIYVSETSGEVVLRTTARERFWAYLGPVTHWVYFTPLRRDGALWTKVIVWSSVGGIVVAVSGLVWGLWRWSPRRRFGGRDAAAMSPYTGLMKWHHYVGLAFGIVTLTWVYSGLLSMEPFGWFQTTGLNTREQRAAMTGGPLEVKELSLDRLQAATAALSVTNAARELETVRFRGDTYWAADEAPSLEQVSAWMDNAIGPRAARERIGRRYVPALAPERGSFAEFDRGAFNEIARRAMPSIEIEDSTWIDAYDGYYYDARGSRPLPVLRVRYRDPLATWLYFDPGRGALAAGNNRTTRRQRWLYQGLHSLDFPWLYFRRPLWDVVVIALSLGGLASALTALVPAWRRLARLVRGIRLWPDDRGQRGT